jgi:general stress protein YciG
MALLLPRIYVYKITFLEVPHYYYGAHLEKKYNEYYMGSPETNKDFWEFYTPMKEIIKEFPLNDDAWSEAQEFEDDLIRPVYNTDPLCLNEHCGGKVSLSARRRGGQTTYELGIGMYKLTKEQHSEKGKRVAQKNKENGVAIFAMTNEERSEAGKKGGRKTYELGLGIYNRTEEKIKEDCSKAGKIGGKISGKKHKENGTGIFKQTKEQRSEAGRKGGKIIGKTNGRKAYENGTGCFKFTPEERREIGRKSGLQAYENKTGIHKRTKEEMSEQGKKNAKLVNAQKWQCTKTGFVSTAGPLSCYQKARGIDTSNRIRLQ